MSPVLDASVWVSAISPAELSHARAVSLVATHADNEPFLVPSLFRVEVIAALARRGEPIELLALHDALLRGPRFHAVPIDGTRIERASDVARIARLRAYDAVYVALALERGAELYTLDREVAERSRRIWPELTIRGT